MASPIRLLLCDDSSVMRRLIKTALQIDPSLEVVCEAKHGRDAVEKMHDARPDVVIMDVEMPVMDGIDAVREIRKDYPHLPIIMFSSLTSRGAEATLDAIEAGATDFSTKPANVGHVGAAMRHVQYGLIPKIHQWSNRGTNPPFPAMPEMHPEPAPIVAPPPEATVAQATHETAAAIGIGVSTGGPKALATLLSALPLDFPAPILVAQHMPPVFTRLLAERLAAQKGHRVREAVHNEEVRPGDILIAPGDYHLMVRRDEHGVYTKLNQEEPENSCRPSVDPLFRSMAQCYGTDCVGLVLTGMGRDGEGGARELKKLGGRIIVQDEASSVVWGMPGNLVRNGLADQVVPLDQLANTLVRSVRRPVAAS